VKLNELKPQAGAKKVPKRRGRGEGSGNGSTAGKGNNGDRARSGHKEKRGFEGGQMPLQRRLPKRGFNSPVVQPEEVNLSVLAKRDGSEFDPAALRKAGLISRADVRVKLIGNAAPGKALKVKVHAITAGARQAVEAAGGSVELIGA
jgi:large subunit ribosomal protein L15